MRLTDIFERRNTEALRGISILIIFVFHFLLQIGCHRVFNICGSVAVAIFLVLSGYGINESFKKNGLSAYWNKRWYHVILPYSLWCLLIHLLTPGDSIRNFLYDLFFIEPSFWFIGHLLRCYVIYWIARRFFPNYLFFVLICFSLVCLHTTIQIEAEQSLSFMFGVLVSEYKKNASSISSRKLMSYAVILGSMAIFFILLKEIPLVHDFKGTQLYNYILLFIKLPAGLVLMWLFTSIGISRWKWMAILGSASLEIYIVHMPLVKYVSNNIQTFLPIGLVILIVTPLFFIFNKRYIERIPISAYLFIFTNTIFIAKYSARITDYWQMVSFAFIIVEAIIFLCLVVLFKRFNNVSSQVLYASVIGFILLGIIFQYQFDPYTIQVDRWSAIHNFLQHLMHGIYPYSAQTHLGGYGSPFPVWQLFHLPFYFIGNVGLSFFLVFALFIISIHKYGDSRRAMFVFILLVLSPAMWYEIAVRSDMLTNFLLCASLINIVLAKRWNTPSYYILVSMILGILLSTRIIVVLPFAILLFRPFTSLSLKQKIISVIIVLTTFSITFLPFVIWNGSMLFFFKYNPFILQTRQGYLTDFIVYIPLVIFLALQWKTNCQLQRNSAMALFAIICVSFVHRMIDSGNYDVFSSLYDITYFNSALPFWIGSLTKR